MEINDKKLRAVEVSPQHIKTKNIANNVRHVEKKEDTVNIKSIEESNYNNKSEKVSELKDKFERGESLEYDSIKVAEAFIKETATIH